MDIDRSRFRQGQGYPAVRRRPVSTVAPIRQPARAGVTSLSPEPVSQPKPLAQPRPAKRRRQPGRASASAVLTVLLVAVAVFGILRTHKAVSSADQKAAHSFQLPFSILTPSGEPQLAHLDSSHYDKTHNSYAFNDLYLGLPLKVSQQPMPDKTTIDQVAASIGADSPFQFNAGTAYLATDAKTGAQAITFTERDLLVFIQSNYKHDATAWASYINSLQ